MAQLSSHQARTAAILHRLPSGFGNPSSVIFLENFPIIFSRLPRVMKSLPWESFLEAFVLPSPGGDEASRLFLRALRPWACSLNQEDDRVHALPDCPVQRE